MSRLCDALAAGDPEAYPVAKKRAAQRAVSHRAVALRRRDGALLWRQRGDGGLWAGMWELPTVEDESSNLEAWVTDETGLRIGPAARRGAFQHVTTHRRIRVEVWESEVVGGRLRRGAGIWRRAENVGDLPLSAAQRKAVKLLESSPDGGAKY